MSKEQSYNKTISRVEGKDLILERVFDAPHELVFKVYSESEHLENWWGPQGWKTENRRFEFKPGGVWHYCMRCTDKNQGDFYGQESWGKVVYHEIVAPEKIVYTDTFSDEHGHLNESLPGVLTTMTFVEYEGKTKLIIRGQYASVDDLQKVKDMGIVEGFSSQMDRLEDYLKQI
ncbi:ATPase [Fischerella thermalis CCMEE 5273]|nr:ATPase [Fischerella thermalis CCMEE 5273]